MTDAHLVMIALFWFFIGVVWGRLFQWVCDKQVKEKK